MAYLMIYIHVLYYNRKINLTFQIVVFAHTPLQEKEKKIDYILILNRSSRFDIGSSIFSSK